MPHITRTDLEHRLSKSKVLSIFEDEPGEFNQEALDAILQAASDLTDATIAASYDGKTPANQPTPAMVKEPTLLYAMAMSIERSAELAAQYGEKVLLGMRKVADALCVKIANGLVRILDGGAPAPGPMIEGGIVLVGGPTLNSTAPGGSFNDGY